MIEYDPIRMEDDQCKDLYTLNTWTDDLKDEARKILKEGFWVSFHSTCIGHTLAEIVRWDGMKWVREEFGEDKVLEAKRDGWSTWYIRLLTA